MKSKMKKNGAHLLVECLEKRKVQYIFGVPGASIMPILDVLVDRGPEFIVCRHEQNAAFMAQAWGRLTGNAGVCLATSGPGATNLITGVMTATADRDPLVAITGQVPSDQRFKKSHQNIDTVPLFAPITKWSIEIEDADTIPEAVANGFRIAESPREGAIHLSLPVNISDSPTRKKPLHLRQRVEMGISPDAILDKAASLINNAKHPVMLLGLGASKLKVTQAMRRLLTKSQMPVIGTFEAAGAVSRDLVHLFVGRVGMKIKEAGDIVLGKADVIVLIGYDPIEYDPGIWNKSAGVKIIHIDEIPASFDQKYEPQVEIIGNTANNLDALTERITTEFSKKHDYIKKTQKMILAEQTRGGRLSGSPVHPMRLIHDLRKIIGDDVTIVSDVGSHQIWLARYFYCYEPRHLLFSMGAQTMGVALPWAIATALARTGKKVISHSGDGSFMMTSMELETAVRLKLPIIHFVWRDGSFNLVEIQQMAKYGRHSGTRFGKIDIVGLTKSFGATAFQIKKPSQIIPTIKKAMKVKGPVVIDLPVNYRDNLTLIQSEDKASLGH